MKKFPRLIFVISFLVAIPSNGCKQSIESDIKSIDLSEYLDKEKKANLTEFADTVWYIHPEYKEDAIIGAYKSVVIVNNMLLILDWTNRLFVYDLKGKLISLIDNEGNGPGEYGEIWSITAIGNYIYLLTANDKVILKYGINGEYIDSHKLESFQIRITNFYSNILCYSNGQASARNNGLRFLVLSPDLHVINELYQTESIDILNRIPSNPAYSLFYYNNTFSFRELGNDTLYRVDQNLNMQPEYFFHFRKQPPEEGGKKVSDVNYSRLNSVIETNKYFLFTTNAISTYHYILYNKDEDVGFNVVFNYSIIDHGFHNDFDGGYPFWPRAQTDEGLLYTWFNPMVFGLKFSNPYFETIDPKYPDLAKDFKALVNTAGDSTNSVIMIVKPRE